MYKRKNKFVLSILEYCENVRYLNTAEWVENVVKLILKKYVSLVN